MATRPWDPFLCLSGDGEGEGEGVAGRQGVGGRDEGCRQYSKYSGDAEVRKRARIVLSPSIAVPPPQTADEEPFDPPQSRI